VRGDSRIDLYAKSLALAGLGLLGAVGAAIDYWPAETRLPQVAIASRSPVKARVDSIIDLRGLEAAPRPAAVIRPTRVAGARVFRASYGETLPPSWSAPAGVDVPPAPRHGVSPAQMLPVAPFSVPTTGGFAWPSVDFATPTEPEPLAPEFADPPNTWQPLPPPASEDTPNAGLFGGMLRKTTASVGSSLTTVSSSLGKASTSLVDAVRAVGGVVKKAF
jgi:hypothetical protein